MTKYLFDVKLFAEVLVTADSEQEARDKIKRAIIVTTSRSLRDTIVGVKFEPIINDYVKLADGQPEQDNL